MAENLCKYDGCGRNVNAYGWCAMHWLRLKRYGTLEPKNARLRLSFEDRFWRFVDKEGVDGCWKWTGAKARHGYGRIGNPGRGSGVSPAHRASYAIHNGPIPEGGVIMHTCDNPECTNPDHLRLGTMKENTQDMLAKGRGRWGKHRKEA